MKKTELLVLALAMLAFYTTGRLVHESLYRFTLHAIRTVSTMEIVYGFKFPFQLMGDPLFGAVISLFPAGWYAGYRFPVRLKKYTLLKQSAMYVAYYSMAYIILCFLWPLFFMGRFSAEQILIPVWMVNANAMFFHPTLTATVLTIGTKWIMQTRKALSITPH